MKQTIQCGATMCRHNACAIAQNKGACQYDGEIELVFQQTGDLEAEDALVCQQYTESKQRVDQAIKEYLKGKLYGWDTEMVDIAVRKYEDTYGAILSDDYQEPTVDLVTWTYGLEDGGYLEVHPCTDTSLRIEHMDCSIQDTAFYTKRKVIYNVWEPELREVE